MIVLLSTQLYQPVCSSLQWLEKQQQQQVEEEEGEEGRRKRQSSGGGGGGKESGLENSFAHQPVSYGPSTVSLSTVNMALKNFTII